MQDSDSPELAEPLPVPWYAGIQDSLTNLAKRVLLYFAFQRAKQPERIKEVLQMVYSSNGERQKFESWLLETPFCKWGGGLLVSQAFCWQS